MNKESFLDQQYVCGLLNIVSRSAVLEDAVKTLNALEMVTDILRYTMDLRKNVVTLREEISIILKHIYLLGLNGSGEIHFEDQTGNDVVYVRHLSVYSLVMDLLNRCSVTSEGMYQLKMELTANSLLSSLSTKDEKINETVLDLNSMKAI